MQRGTASNSANSSVLSAVQAGTGRNAFDTWCGWLSRSWVTLRALFNWKSQKLGVPRCENIADRCSKSREPWTAPKCTAENTRAYHWTWPQPAVDLRRFDGRRCLAPGRQGIGWRDGRDRYGIGPRRFRNNLKSTPPYRNVTDHDEYGSSWSNFAHKKFVLPDGVTYEWLFFRTLQSLGVNILNCANLQSTKRGK